MARVLVVDDEADFRLLCRTMLEDAGHDVLEAADGQEALDTLSSSSPDLVLLDITMPLRSGWEVLGELKSDARLRSIPVVIMSWRGEPDAQIRGIASGAAAYVAKPHERESLLRVVESTLSRAPREPGSPATEA